MSIPPSKDLEKSMHDYLDEQMSSFVKDNIEIKVEMVEDDELEKNCVMQANVKIVGPSWYIEKLKELQSKNTEE